jgi:hypothetical protein
MDQATRAELEKLHGRINDLKERIVLLEADRPYVREALARIESAVSELRVGFKADIDQFRGYFVKFVWVVAVALIGAIMQFIIRGGLSVN